jgi:prophage antirepressor-like protein
MNKIFSTLDKNFIIYGNQQIIVLFDVNNDVWFHAKQTTKSLGYSDLKQALKKNVNKKNIMQYKQLQLVKKIQIQPHTSFLSESGLYSLILRSRMKEAKEFTEWLTDEVLPSIRKYGSYKMKQKYTNNSKKLFQKIKFLQKQFETIKSDFRKEKFPSGALVYVIDYSDNNKNIYRIGKTNSMITRKSIYDTHTFHKYQVVFMKECKYPTRLETCLKSMLYDFRYKNNKDFYLCSLSTIKKAINKCIKDFDQFDNQKGGSKTNKKNKTPFEKYLVNEIIKLEKQKRKLGIRIKKLSKMISN